MNDMARPRISEEQAFAEDAAGNPLDRKGKPKRRYELDEIRLPGIPRAPTSIQGDALKIWLHTVRELAAVAGLLSPLDWALLADFCELRAAKDVIEHAMRVEINEARKSLIAAKKAQTPGRNFHIVKGEVTAKWQKTIHQLRQREGALRRELGMSPSGRTQVKINPSAAIQATETAELQEHRKEIALENVFSGMGPGMRPV